MDDAYRKHLVLTAGLFGVCILGLASGTGWLSVVGGLALLIDLTYVFCLDTPDEQNGGRWGLVNPLSGIGPSAASSVDRQHDDHRPQGLSDSMWAMAIKGREHDEKYVQQQGQLWGHIVRENVQREAQQRNESYRNSQQQRRG